MFRPRYGGRRHYGRGGGGGFGLLLLAMQLLSFFNFLAGSDRFFPVTLGVMGLNIVAYLRPRGMSIHWPSITEACISVQRVWFQGDWKRLFTSPFVHSGDYHLYYNMASFMWKAVTLERYFGSAYFAYMVTVFSIATGLLYLGLHYIMAEFLDQWSAVQSCAVGFSAVIFALKVVTTHIQPRGMTLIMGFFPIPTRLACWAELVIISVLFPNVSFIGHLAGILVGLAYVWGPLKMVMDIPASILNTMPTAGGVPHVHAGNSYTYRAAPTGYRGEGRRDGDDEAEERELQAAIQTSLQHQERHTAAAPTASSHLTNRRDSLDRDLQIALDRSIRDQGPSPPEAAPPPYNPSYNPPLEDPEADRDVEGETEGEEEREVEGDVLPSDTTTVRHRHIRGREQAAELDLDAVRAARLRKFQGTRQH